MAAELRAELEAMTRRLAELSADNTMLKITVNTLVERLDEIEGSSGGKPTVKSARGPTKLKKDPSSGGSSSKLVVEDDDDAAPARPKKKVVKKATSKDLIAPSKSKSSGSLAADEAEVYYVGKKKLFGHAPPGFDRGSVVDVEPSTGLEMDFVYGYNGRTAGANLFYGAKGSGAYSKIIYCIAAVGIHFDPARRTQDFFLGHNEDISSLCVHPLKPIAATGQVDPKGTEKPYVCIWNSNSMKEMTRIGGFYERAVCAMGFSGDGKMFAAVGEDDNHTVAVWDWESDTKQPIGLGNVSKGAVYGISSNVHQKECFEFCTYGAKHVKTWSIDKRKERDAKGKFKLNGRLAGVSSEEKAFNCAVYLPTGQLAVGGASGTIYVLNAEDLSIATELKTHTKAVGAMCLTPKGFASAGRDGKLVVYSTRLQVELEVQLGPVKPRSLDFSSVGGGSYAVGTGANQILEVTGLDTGKPNVTVKMDGHSAEIWGLARHPTDPVIATGAHDFTVRLWDYKNRCALDKQFESKSEIRSVAFHPNGKQLAAGTKSGRLIVLNYPSMEKVWEKKFRSEQIDALNFSPNGQLLALGSWDQMVELVDLETPSSVVLKGHTASVTHLTFSFDSKYLMTNSRDYEILYWDCETAQRLNAPDCAGAVWYDWQNILGWHVKGIWQKGMDGTDINAVHVSGDPESSAERVCAVADDSGLVHLHRFPVVGKTNPCKTYGGHSSHVTNVRFSIDDKFLFSAGGADLAVIQWKHRRG